MSKPVRILIVLVGMTALGVLFSGAPMLISSAIWLVLWLGGAITDNTTSGGAWIGWVAVLVPLAVYLATLYLAISWVRRAPAG